jgi:hypothetical protein
MGMERTVVVETEVRGMVTVMGRMVMVFDQRSQSEMCLSGRIEIVLPAVS